MKTPASVSVVMLIDKIFGGVTGWLSSPRRVGRHRRGGDGLADVVARDQLAEDRVAEVEETVARCRRGSVMKNSELLPSTPLLAMASRPLEVKRKSAFNSTGIVLPVPPDAALDHEILDDPVERGVRVGARVDQADEVATVLGV